MADGKAEQHGVRVVTHRISPSPSLCATGNVILGPHLRAGQCVDHYRNAKRQSGRENSGRVIEHQLGGAVRRVDRDATAFGYRDVEYSFMSLGVCADAAEAEKCTRWAREFWNAMQPWSTGGVYVNYLGREVDEGAGRIEAAYGPEKYARLVALKNKYDPANLFRLNQNIKPSLETSVARSA